MPKQIENNAIWIPDFNIGDHEKILTKYNCEWSTEEYNWRNITANTEELNG